MCAMDVDTTDYSRFACGGKELLLRVWDLETKKIEFQARNVKHDYLNLRSPVWIRDIDVFPQTSHKIAVGTAHHQVRLFDTKAGRRAQINKEVSEHAVISVVVHPDENHVTFGDAVGAMRTLDLRTQRVVASFKGFSGSIRSITYDDSEPLMIAGGGLDRFVRVYDTKTRALKNKCYVKQQINQLLFTTVDNLPAPAPAPQPVKSADGSSDSESESESSDYDDDDDEDAVWNTLDRREKRRLEKRQKLKQQQQQQQQSDSESGSDDEDEDEDVSDSEDANDGDFFNGIDDDEDDESFDDDALAANDASSSDEEQSFDSDSEAESEPESEPEPEPLPSKTSTRRGRGPGGVKRKPTTSAASQSSTTPSSRKRRR
jgi:WD40 repeat protein